MRLNMTCLTIWFKFQFHNFTSYHICLINQIELLSPYKYFVFFQSYIISLNKIKYAYYLSSYIITKITIFWLLNFDNFILEYDVSFSKWFLNIENEKEN